MAVGRAGDREVIVSGGYDGTVRVWDAVTGQPALPAADRPHQHSDRGGGGPGRGPRGDRLRQLRRYGAGLGRGHRQPAIPPRTGHTSTVTAVAVGRAGDRDVIVSGDEDGTVRVWDAVTGQPVVPPLTGHTDPVAAVAVGRAGDRDVIVSGDLDGTVRVWDAVTGQPARPAADRPHRPGGRGGGGPGRGPRRDRLRRRGRDGAGLGRGDRAAGSARR